MKHSIRQRVIDPVTGLKVTKIETVTGELGSGIFDFNGKEIFEGDIVTVGADNRQCTVRFKNGAFRVGEANIDIWGSVLEIVGHVDD